MDRSVPRPKATNRRVSESRSISNSPSPGVFSQQSFDMLVPLPMHTSELGILPVHHEVQPNAVFDWSLRSSQTSQQIPQASQIQPPPSTSLNMSQEQYSWTPAAAYSAGQYGSSVNDLASGSMLPQPMPEFMSSSFGSSSFGSQTQLQESTTQFDLNAAPELLDILFQQPINMNIETSQQANANKEAYMHKDTLQMWSNAPTGFEWGDWCDYIENVNGQNLEPLSTDGSMYGSMDGTGRN